MAKPKIHFMEKHRDAWQTLQDDIAREIADLQEAHRALAKVLGIVSPYIDYMGIGLVAPDVKDGRSGNMAPAVVDILKHAKNPLSHKSIKTELTGVGYAQQLKADPAYYYGTVARLVKQGQIIKNKNKTYKIP